MNSNVIHFSSLLDSRKKPIAHKATELSALSSGLMLILHIPADRSLVSLLGHSQASSNHAAIIAWISHHWSPSQLERLNKPLDTLSQALSRYLNDKIHTH